MKKLMLIIWGWKEALCNGENLPWVTPEKENELWLANVHDNIEEIADYIKKISPPTDAEILVFLHGTPPHSYNRNDQEKLNTLLDKSVTLRSRLFSGGKDRVYFGEHNLLGIIGVNGGIALSYEEKKTLNSIDANLILHEENHIINQDHFNHVWNAYWNKPDDAVFRLAEKFNWLTRGVDWTTGDRISFIAHLSDHSDLWQQLHSFAGIEPKNATIIKRSALEYNLDAYSTILGRAGYTELQTHINSVRAGVENLLNSGSFDGEPQEETVSCVYNALFDLYKEIVDQEYF